MDRPQFRYSPPRRNSKNSIQVKVAILLVFLIIYVVLALNKPLPGLKISATPVYYTPKNITINWPHVSQAAFGSQDIGLIANSPKPQAPAPIASVAKVITALAVLKQKPISEDKTIPLINLSAEDVSYYEYYKNNDGSNVLVEEGESLSEYQALQALLLPSANNIADSLAAWAFGSKEAYIYYANNMLKSFGLNNTTVADPSGFSQSTVSTASDLIIIGQKAMENKVIKEIVGQTEAEIPVAGKISNTNALLASHKVVGIKTGHTNEAGGCYLFATEKVIDPHHTATIIGAIIGGDNLSLAFSSAQTLIDSVLPNFTNITLASMGTSLGTLTSVTGEKTDLVIGQYISADGWAGSNLTTKLDTSKQFKEIDANQEVGKITLKSPSGETSYPLVAKSAIKKPSITWRILHYF